MIYTGIGSRETPEHVLLDMRNIGITMAALGHTLRSGGAPGADTAFEEGCAAGPKEIYIPWAGFGGRHDAIVVPYNPDMEAVAERFHPAWHRCSQGARKLHTRNVPQIVGLNLQTKSDLVICWTKDGRASGGTGQALRIAEYLGIPVFNLFNEGASKAAYDFVMSHGRS